MTFVIIFFLIFFIIIFLTFLVTLNNKNNQLSPSHENEGDIFENEFYFIFPNGTKTKKILKIKLKYNLDENLINQEFDISSDINCKNQIILTNKSFSFKVLNKEIYNYITQEKYEVKINHPSFNDMTFPFSTNKNNNKLIGKVIEFSEGVLKLKMKILK